MGFFSRIFGKSEEEKQREKMEAIFSKMREVLNNDDLQNEMFLHPMLKNQIDSTPMDRLPGAVGDYGRDIRNPILCNGPMGEVTYLSKLRVADNGAKMIFHRLGSRSNMDMYELISVDGRVYDVLYLDMYHAHKSRLAPSGYKLEEQVVFPTGTNQVTENFPSGFDVVLKKMMESITGVALLDPDLRNVHWVNLARIVRGAREQHDPKGRVEAPNGAVRYAAAICAPLIMLVKKYERNLTDSQKYACVGMYLGMIVKPAVGVIGENLDEAEIEDMLNFLGEKALETFDIDGEDFDISETDVYRCTAEVASVPGLLDELYKDDVFDLTVIIDNLKALYESSLK